MIHQKTTFVLGAGASCEADMTLGSELLSKVANSVLWKSDYKGNKTGDMNIRNILLRLFQHSNTSEYHDHVIAGAKLFANAQNSASIDDVLYNLQDAKATFVGKLSIVKHILSAERKSPVTNLTHGPIEVQNINSLRSTWYGRFFAMASVNCNILEINRVFDNIRFINFNYDRTLEVYLLAVLRYHYGVDEITAARIVNDIDIIRPYGRAGRLLWTKGDEHVSDFGGDEYDNNLVEIADGIRTYTELKTDDMPVVTEIRNILKTSRFIVFLGFGFHRQNLDMLATDTLYDVQVIGTVKGIPKGQVPDIKKNLRRLLQLKSEPILDDIECSLLMPEIERKLTSPTH